MAVWSSLRSFGIYFQFWYVWTKKNLATLTGRKALILKNRREKAADGFTSGANPTIVSYSASDEKNYNAKSCLVRFENKNIFFYIEKRSSLLQRRRCSSKFVGSAPALFSVSSGRTESQLSICSSFQTSLQKLSKLARFKDEKNILGCKKRPRFLVYDAQYANSLLKNRTRGSSFFSCHPRFCRFYKSTAVFK
jgi:hypothetical protein